MLQHADTNDETWRIQNAIQEYVQIRENFEKVVPQLRDMLEELLKDDPALADPPYPGPPNIFSCEARVKTISSFEEKLKRPGRTYANPLEDIKDLIGLRVVAFYEEDVDIASRIIPQVFQIVEDRDDIINRLEPEEFGYLSRHFVVQLLKKDWDRPKWRVLKNVQFEIQIRTILQHSWASLEHKLTYKRRTEAPKAFRRDIARLAALLEIAEDLSTKLQGRRQEQKREYEKQISQNDYKVPLDIDSLSIYLDHTRVDEEWGNIGKKIGWTVEILDSSNEEVKGRIRQARSNLLRILQFAQVQTVRDVDDILHDRDHEYIEYLTRLHAALVEARLHQFATRHDILRGIVIYHHRNDITSIDLTKLGYDDSLVRLYQKVCGLSLHPNF